METFTINVSPGVRRVTENGRKYLVANATILVGDQVLHGSKGKLFYSKRRCALNVGEWNKQPIVHYHPVGPDGRPAAAHNADGTLDRNVIEKFGLGEVRDDSWNGRSRNVNLWFDDEHTRDKSPDIYGRLNRNESFELSTGLFTKDRPVENGRSPSGDPYTHEVEDWTPDHLAVLPDQVGACSRRMGCGVLNAEGYCANCGGTGGKPGPCPEGDAAHAAQKSFETDPKVAAEKGPAHAAEHVALMHRKAARAYADAGTKDKSDEHAHLADLHERHAEASRKLIGNTDERRTLLHRFGEWLGLAGNENPEGHNQYTGSASHAAEQATAKAGGGERAKDLQHKASMASIGGDHATAARMHGMAAAQHEKDGAHVRALDPAEADLHAAAAKAHADAAAYHRGLTKNALGSGNHGLARRAAHADELTTAANDADAGDDHATARDAHEAAADAHRAAAREAADGSAAWATPDYFASGRHANAAAAHDAKAAEHGALCANTELQTSTEGDDMGLDRTATITSLATNCECWKGKEKVLNTFDDDALGILARQSERLKTSELAANSLLKIAKDNGAPAELTLNALPKFIADKMNDDDSSVVDDANKKKEPATNSLAPINERLTADEQEALAVANEIRGSARKAFVDRIVTANAASAEAAKAIRPTFEAMTYKQLKVLADNLPRTGTRPTVNQDEVDTILDFSGLGGYAANRRGDEPEFTEADLCPVTVNADMYRDKK